MGHPLADAYRSANIERVEVIRGPASTLYGSNAMGGVINIITKEQKNEGFSTKANVSYGSYNTQRYSLGGGYKKHKISVYAGINYDKTDGHREASFFNNTDGYFKVEYSISKHFDVLGDFSLTQFNGADPGLDTSDVISAIPGDTLDIFRGMGAVVLNNKFDKFDGSVNLFYNFGKHDITSGFLSNDYNYGVVFYENLHLIKGNTITLGVDYKTYGGKADLTKFKGGVVIVDTAMRELAGYIMVQQKLFSKLVFDIGLRADRHSTFGTELVPTGGVAYEMSKNTNIKSSISKGFRSPTIRELFIQFPFAPAPNPNLQPERIINYEISIQQKMLQQKLKFELGLFHIEGDNLINVGKENNKLTFLNTGKVNNSGVEFGVKQYVNKWLSLNSNYTYINMEKPVTGTPKHKLYISGNVFINKFSMNLSYQYIKDLVVATDIQESYNLLNLRLAYNICKTTNVYIKADNILNKEYVINYGYPMPGIVIMGGINFHISTP
jgi:iron complex outermembrane receptor protein